MVYDIPSPLDCILDAVLTESPNRQYLGVMLPITPATTGPVSKIKQSPLEDAYSQDFSLVMLLSIQSLYYGGDRNKD